MRGLPQALLESGSRKVLGHEARMLDRSSRQSPQSGDVTSGLPDWERADKRRYEIAPAGVSISSTSFRRPAAALEGRGQVLLARPNRKSCDLPEATRANARRAEGMKCERIEAAISRPATEGGPDVTSADCADQPVRVDL